MKYSQKIIFQNLAVADMLLSVHVISICVYIHIYNQDYIHIYEKWRYSFTCRSIRSLVWISGLVSKFLFFLLTISHLIITKYALVVHPLSKKQIGIILLVIWVIGHILFMVLTNLEGTDITCLFFKRENITIISTYITVVMTSLTFGIIVSNYLIYDAVYCSLKNVRIECSRKLKSLKNYLTCVSVFEVMTLSFYLFVVYSNLYISTHYIHIVLVQLLFSLTIVSHQVIFINLKNRR